MTTNKKNQFQKKFRITENLLDTIFTLLIFVIIFIIISNPSKFTSGTISGLKLFFFNVLPGLFPFMLLTKLITELGVILKTSQKLDKFSYKVFGTPGVSIFALVMSILSGYPIGAKIIADLYSKNQITEVEAKKMSVFCTTSGPIFVIGAVGVTMFNSYKFGLILYFSHILSSIILGILFNLVTKKKTSKNNNLVIKQKLNIIKTPNIISNSINQTINSLFIVAAYITIFYLIAEILETLKVFAFLTNALFFIFSKFGLNINQTSGLIYGILEVTRGSKVLSTSLAPASVILASGIISFSGLSIIMQSMAFLKEAKIKAHSFVLAKCVHCVCSMFLCFLFFFII